MSGLAQFAAHARRMATAEHRPDWTGKNPTPAKWTPRYEDDDVPTALELVALPKPPTCTGCVTPAERRQWEALATEAEQRLAQRTDKVPATREGARL